MPPALCTAVGKVQTVIYAGHPSLVLHGGAGTDGEAVLPWGW